MSHVNMKYRHLAKVNEKRSLTNSHAPYATTTGPFIFTEKWTFQWLVLLLCLFNAKNKKIKKSSNPDIGFSHIHFIICHFPTQENSTNIFHSIHQGQWKLFQYGDDLIRSGKSVLVVINNDKKCVLEIF